MANNAHNLKSIMARLVGEHVKHYQSDWEHDLSFMRENPNVRFIWIVRECGTNIVAFETDDTLPAPGVKIPYLFGTADRRHVLQSCAIMAEYEHGDEKARFIVDPATDSLRPISKADSAFQMKKHVMKMLDSETQKEQNK